jgi:hypothetical protein
MYFPRKAPTLRYPFKVLSLVAPIGQAMGRWHMRLCRLRLSPHVSKQSKGNTDARGSEAVNATPWRQVVQRGKTGYTNDVLLLVSVKLFPFGGESESPNSELLKLATGEGSMGFFIGFSFTTDAMDYFMSDSTIHFVSTNMLDRFEQMGVTACVLKRSNGSRHRCRIPMKMSLDGRCLGAKSSNVKRVAEIVTYEYVTSFAMSAA